MTKKLHPVLTGGGTVVFQGSDRVAILTTATYLLLWISFDSQPEFKKFRFTEGESVWFYFIEATKKIVSVVPFADVPSLEELPPVAPIEVDEEKARQDGQSARY